MGRDPGRSSPTATWPYEQMSFLCPARVRRAARRRKARHEDAPLPGRITGSASIDTLVRVGLEKESLYYEGRPSAKILHDFSPCVAGELRVCTGDHVTLLYRENDWVYAITADGREGFVPFHFCGAGTSSEDIQVHNTRPSSTVGSDSTREGLNISRSSNLNRAASASLPSLNDIYGTATKCTTASTITHTPLGTPLDHQRPHGVRNEGYLRHDLGDSLSNSNASDTPLLDTSSEAASFAKIPSGKFMVLFRFQSLEENDVSVDRGEFVTVLNRDDPDWFWVARSEGTEGFVPSRFLCPAGGMSVKDSSPPHPARPVRSVATSPQAPTSPMQPNTTRLVVLHDFCARDPDDLTVCRGDWVYADLGPRVQTDPDWLWVFLPGPDKWGYLPRNYIRRPTSGRAMDSTMTR